MKAFAASFALISCFILMMSVISASHETEKGMNGVKNTIMLWQRTNELQYSMQHDFENTVKESKLFLTSQNTDIDNSVIICSKIMLINDYSVESGCINDDYEIDRAATEMIRVKDAALDLVSEKYTHLVGETLPCLKFIRYDKTNGSAVIGLNTKVDYENSIINCNNGFVLKSNVSNHGIKTVIPMETMI